MDRLQKASACENDIGDRYSRLIKLLWRKPPGRGSVAEPFESTRPAADQMPADHDGGGHADQTMFDTNAQAAIPPSINTFSWLDLPAVGDFALTNNDSISGSFDGLDRFEDSSTDGIPGFDYMMMPQQYGGWADNSMSPSGVIF